MSHPVLVQIVFHTKTSELCGTETYHGTGSGAYCERLVGHTGLQPLGDGKVNYENLWFWGYGCGETRPQRAE